MSDAMQPSCGGTRSSCDEVLARLWEYIDGELTPDSTAEVKQHLEKCSGCYPHYDFQRAFCTFLQQQAKNPAPPGLRRRVFEMLLEEERKVRSD